MHIGNFGKERPPLVMTFGWFGHEVRVEPNLTDMVLMDFLGKATAIEDEASPEAMHAVEEFLAAMIHPDDFADFMRVGKEHRQTIEDLMTVAYSVLEAATDRPTQAPVVSSDGRSKTPAASTVNSSALAVRRDLERRRRPDLALAVLQAEEVRASKAG